MCSMWVGLDHKKWHGKRKICWHLFPKHRHWLGAQKRRWNPWVCWAGCQWGEGRSRAPLGPVVISVEFCSTLKLLCVTGAPSLGTLYQDFLHFLFSLSDYLLVFCSFSSFSQVFLANVVCFHILFWITAGQEVVDILFIPVLFFYPFFSAWASFTANQIYCLLLVAIFLFIEFPSPPHSFPCGSPFSIVLVLYFPPKILKQLLEDEAFNLIFHLQLALY